MGKDLESEEVPVLDIFKEVSGALVRIKGHYRHHGIAPPQYDFKVKIEVN